MNRVRTPVYILILALLFSFTGCAHHCDWCVEEPEAVAADDNRSTGVYKGVLTGENVTGTLRAWIATDESEGICEIWLNFHEDYHKASQFEIDDVDGDVQYGFSGDRFEFVLRLTDEGEIQDSTLALDGENVDVDVEKELSDELVMCFEGTWWETPSDDEEDEGDEGDEEGEEAEMLEGFWNFLIQESWLEGSFDGDAGGSYTGEITGESIQIWTTGGSDLAIGVLDGQEAEGTWDYWYSGEWAGKRSL